MVSVGGFFGLCCFLIIFHLLPPSLFVLKRSETALHWGVGNAKDRGYLAQKWNGTFAFPFWNWAWAYIASMPFQLGSEAESIYLISNIKLFSLSEFAYLGHSKLY